MKTEGIYWVGRLATLDEIKSNGLGRSNCFVNKWDALQFYVKVISKMPGEINNEEYVSCYSNRIDHELIVDNGAFDEDERAENYEKQLSQFLFGFIYEKNQTGYNVAKNIDVIELTENDYNDQTFCAIPAIISDSPVFHNDKKYSTFHELIDEIKKREYICKLNKYDTSDLENIPYILYYDTETMSYRVIGNFSGFLYEATQGIKFNYAELKEFEFEEDWYESVKTFPKNKHIVFIDNYLHKKILNKLDTTQAIDIYTLEEDSVEMNDSTDDIDKNDEEWDFIEHFDAVARKDGLYYKKKDLVNFHTAVKTGSLVILSGISGTGKSQLVQCYAKALGLGDNGFYLIPVRPSWSDDGDLIGFVDSMHMVYRPSDTGFINILIEAGLEKNKEKLYLICLDEMNLARVEHYFSQFLSILEMPEKARELNLYTSDFTSRLYNSDKYPQRVNIGNNVKFIGTVNIDESTFHFSDKVLDRANVIKLDIVPYTDWNTVDSATKGVLTDAWSYTTFKKYTKDGYDLTMREKEFLWHVHCIFYSVSNNLGVGPRILKQIGRYLSNLPEIKREDNISREEGFDIQFVQRVLTKLRGQKEQLREILDEKSEKGLYNLLDKYQDISTFEKTKEVLKNKSQEIENYGYTL